MTDKYLQEIREELASILDYWLRMTKDDKHGGFIGRIDHQEVQFPEATKGCVLNCRILWTFSAAYQLTQDPEHLAMAERAYEYIINQFVDKQYGGVYWSVDKNGRRENDKKQTYAIAFALYALSEFYVATKKETALVTAIELYSKIVDKTYSKENPGYLEAFQRDWSPLQDLRLSAKDENAPLSMNTHLHILEAFANLYRAQPQETLKQRIKELIRIFLDHIINTDNYHLQLFFTKQWRSTHQIISYGHDIEAAWLIQQAAETIDETALTNEVKAASIKIARACLEGLDSDGGLWYEYDVMQQRLIKEKHWWVQAEAMIGFYNTWQLTNDEQWLIHSTNSWDFVKKYLKEDTGEWKWGVLEDHKIMINQDKVGVWKCPYHNGRACLELIKRIVAT